MQPHTIFALTALVVVYSSAGLASKNPRRTRGEFRQLDAKEIEEEELGELAQFAATTVAKAEKRAFHDAVLNITEAHQQTVAGWNTKMKLVVSETSCPIHNPFDVGQCIPKNASITRQCDVLVYERPWEHIKELTSFYCH
ncbi:salivary cystatin-L2-like isoform X2 [Varroa jacobsoni]|nr:salivary cystatin-L2-like isoform X2 [Varroa destructor]XP_022688692.1 salivary cystatin-L2-like isoform X2 [Varroa jacobsoni]